MVQGTIADGEILAATREHVRGLRAAIATRTAHPDTRGRDGMEEEEMLMLTGLLTVRFGYSAELADLTVAACERAIRAELLEG